MSPLAEVVSPAPTRSLKIVVPVQSQVFPVAMKVPAFELVPFEMVDHDAVEPVAQTAPASRRVTTPEETCAVTQWPLVGVEAQTPASRSDALVQRCQFLLVVS